MSTVLVTGGSGFIVGHSILQLLAAGHDVRATVRSLKREGDVRAALRGAGAEAGSRLTFFAAISRRMQASRNRLPGAITCCTSRRRFPRPSQSTGTNLSCPPATARSACYAPRATPASSGWCSPRRSRRSVTAHEPQTAPFDETSWTNTEAPGVTPYAKSKTFAERAAWDFIASESGSLELSVVNPVAVFGPVLGADHSTSVLILKRLLDGGMLGCPRLYFGVVDLRDVASLHLAATSTPAAKAERFIAVSGDAMSILDIAHVLQRLGDEAKKVPARELPDCLVRIATLRDPAIKPALPELGKRKNMTGEKAKRILQWSPRSPAEAILATAESLTAEARATRLRAS